MRSIQFRRLLPLLVLLSTLVTGCGQKGDLYLPPEPDDAQLTATEQAPLPA